MSQRASTEAVAVSEKSTASKPVEVLMEGDDLDSEDFGDDFHLHLTDTDDEQVRIPSP